MKKEYYWPIGIALTLLIFVGFLVTAFFISRSVPINLVSNDYYQKGIAYQQQIDRMKRSRQVASRLGWQYDANRQVITISFPHNSPVGPVEGTISFYRPSDAGMDISVPIGIDENGTQHINVSSLEKGYWRVFIIWQQNNTEYYAEKILTIR